MIYLDTCVKNIAMLYVIADIQPHEHEALKIMYLLYLLMVDRVCEAACCAGEYRLFLIYRQSLIESFNR